MDPQIRAFRSTDAPDVVRLSIRAWAPVFDAELDIVGPELFERLEGKDWRVRQQKSVEDVLADEAVRVWVADVDGRPSASRRPSSTSNTPWARSTCLRWIRTISDRGSGLR
jgi:hypothetical protein